MDIISKRLCFYALSAPLGLGEQRKGRKFDYFLINSLTFFLFNSLTL